MENKEVKVVAVIAEKRIHEVFGAALTITQPTEPPAHQIELWLDCLNPGLLNEQSIHYLMRGVQHPMKKVPLTVSIRHIDSVPPERRYFEGFKGDEKDWDRNTLIRKANECEPNYIEMEHDHRWNVFCITSTIMRYSDFSRTPSFDELRSIFDDIKRRGADIVKFETYARNEDDLDNLRKLRQEHAKDSPLITLALGKAGKKLWLEACEDGSPFVYGHTNRLVDYVFGKKKPHDFMPSLSDVNHRLSVIAQKRTKLVLKN